jgi:hypothetical protein
MDIVSFDSRTQWGVHPIANVKPHFITCAGASKKYFDWKNFILAIQ